MTKPSVVIFMSFRSCFVPILCCIGFISASSAISCISSTIDSEMLRPSFPLVRSEIIRILLLFNSISIPSLFLCVTLSRGSSNIRILSIASYTSFAWSYVLEAGTINLPLPPVKPTPSPTALDVSLLVFLRAINNRLSTNLSTHRRRNSSYILKLKRHSIHAFCHSIGRIGKS